MVAVTVHVFLVQHQVYCFFEVWLTAKFSSNPIVMMIRINRDFLSETTLSQTLTEMTSSIEESKVIFRKPQIRHHVMISRVLF